MADEQLPPETVTYWAISIFNSKTFWWNVANFIPAMLSLTEIVQLIPVRFIGIQLALVAAVNLWLRTSTIRPVALIKPFATTPINVDKIGPPAPPVLTD